MLLTYLTAMGGKDMKVGDVTAFVKELKIEMKNASELLRQAGCIMKKGKGADSGTGVELRVPLVFPGPKRGRK